MKQKTLAISHYIHVTNIKDCERIRKFLDAAARPDTVLNYNFTYDKCKSMAVFIAMFKYQTWTDDEDLEVAGRSAALALNSFAQGANIDAKHIETAYALEKGEFKSDEELESETAITVDSIL